MMMGSARGFSTTIDTDDSDLEEAASTTSAETQKGRFFKFLEKAEELDDKIKVNPTEAKKVTSEADSEALEEPAIMFDADEIEISFADLPVCLLMPAGSKRSCSSSLYNSRKATLTLNSAYSAAAFLASSSSKTNLNTLGTIPTWSKGIPKVLPVPMECVLPDPV